MNFICSNPNPAPELPSFSLPTGVVSSRKWRDLHDIDFEKFIGAALVPKWNPFLGDSQETASQMGRPMLPLSGIRPGIF